MVYRIYVEKKPRFAVDGGAVLADLNVALGIKTVENVRIINRYDCEKLPKENFEAAVPTVFSEPPVDEVYYELPKPAADELLAGTDTAKTESKTAQAQMLILELLANGKRMPSAELEKAVNERGISSRTMRTAKSRIGDRLVTEKDGTAWVCYLRD